MQILAVAMEKAVGLIRPEAGWNSVANGRAKVVAQTNSRIMPPSSVSCVPSISQRPIAATGNSKASQDSSQRMILAAEGLMSGAVVIGASSSLKILDAMLRSVLKFTALLILARRNHTPDASQFMASASG
jgi:hypothetical protein